MTLPPDWNAGLLVQGLLAAIPAVGVVLIGVPVAVFVLARRRWAGVLLGAALLLHVLGALVLPVLYEAGNLAVYNGYMLQGSIGWDRAVWSILVGVDRLVDAVAIALALGAAWVASRPAEVRAGQSSGAAGAG